MSKRGPRRPIGFRAYRLRTCRYMNECAICGETIACGERYYDGGYGRRAHEKCVAGVTGQERKP